MTELPDRARWFHELVEHGGPLPPAAATLGFRLVALDAEAGTVEGTFEGRPEFANVFGGVQGGFLAAMLDTTMSCALLAALPSGHGVPTLQMAVSYLEPAPLGPLTGHGRVLRRGRSVAFLAGELHRPDGTLVTAATATARIVDLGRD